MSENRSGPRKVIVGTAMHNMFRPYPGLQTRLGELASLVDRMAEEAAARYDGARLDIAVLPEMAVNGGREGTAAEVSYPLDGPVLEVMGAKARARQCYIVVPLYLVDNRERGLYSNAAALVDRQGQVAGIYRKVFAVVAHGAENAEGGVMPGTDFPVFDCDFGRVGIQICYDMAFDEGWEALRRKGAELIAWPSQWPGQIHAASRALRGGCFVLSSTWRNNASLLDPTGHLLREIRADGVFVEQIDLDYAILGWQPTLRNGAAFAERFGARVGYRYSEVEDCGIFWSNDPTTPIAEMVRALNLETKAAELERCRNVLTRLRGGPPALN
ncbi:MAG TPA: carbon-nitrogen hydrolase family protein [Chthonomonadaceae bacterium]|nr:carbon-nitrogen hydrolase family protein [Chthonomonadaceae bacterium]